MSKHWSCKTGTRLKTIHTNNNRSMGAILYLAAFIPLGLIFQIASGIVVHQIRSISSKSGRTDYALAGETVELSCHYMMKDEFEDIKTVVWSKDGINFLRWRKLKPGLEVLDYTFKGHVDSSSKHSHIILHNITIDMHGRYKCFVRTDLNEHEQEHDLIVISNPGCRLSDWRVLSEPGLCRESFKLDCKQMFPRPVPSCGLWNDKTDKFIRSIAIDISEESSSIGSNNPNQSSIDYGFKSTANNQNEQNTSNLSGLKVRQQNQRRPTFRIWYREKFELSMAEKQNSTNQTKDINIDHISNNENKINLDESSGMYIANESKKFSDQVPGPSASEGQSQIGQRIMGNSDLFQYAEHLVFKCDIVVPETSWKLSLVHKMFNYKDGCSSNPLETIDWLRQNYSQSVGLRLQEYGIMSSPSNMNLQSEQSINNNNNPNLGLVYSKGSKYQSNQLSDYSSQRFLSNSLQMSGLEMLAPDLIFELRGASKIQNVGLQQSALMYDQQPKLNCWKKPRLGTIAHLSCANKRAKLIGANKLECRQNGWVLLTDSVLQNVKRVSSKSRNSRRVGDSLSNNSKINIEEQTTNTNIGTFTNSSIENINNLTNNSHSISRNNDQDQDEVSSIDLDTQKIDADGSSISNIPTVQWEDFDLSRASSLISSDQVLLPSQLAALLPSCISPVIRPPTTPSPPSPPRIPSSIPVASAPGKKQIVVTTTSSEKKPSSKFNSSRDGNRLAMRVEQTQVLESLGVDHTTGTSQQQPKADGSGSSACKGVADLTVFLSVTLAIIQTAHNVQIMMSSG